MTDETRTAVLEGLWAAVRGLVPTSKLAEFPRLVDALQAVYQEYGDQQLEAGYALGLKHGLLSTEAREDRRDLFDVEDAPELRSVH